MLRLTAIITSLLFVTSCAATSPQLNLGTPVNIYGVSSLSPQNGSWSVITSTGYQVVLGTKLNDNSSGIINMSLYQLPEFYSDQEFLTHVVKHRASSADIGRFELKQNTEELVKLNGATCVKHTTISQDNNAKIDSNKSASMQIEYLGYNCIHPFKKSVGVHTEYSFRHFKDKEHPELTKNAEEFFSNIKFKEL
ncbi:MULTISPECIES: hypothetical protein [Alteromonadaceae]|uniref:hypothetical protein n=1 Tax=Alteromonadaceae TaxID=72275 RepID=UPI00310BE9D4